jgi:hypothetical protein
MMGGLGGPARSTQLFLRRWLASRWLANVAGLYAAPPVHPFQFPFSL